LTPNELVLTFRGSYVCANFCENRSRNATVRVPTDGQTHTQTDTQTQTDFIICPMLYAIAMGQIIMLTPSGVADNCGLLCCLHGLLYLFYYHIGHFTSVALFALPPPFRGSEMVCEGPEVKYHVFSYIFY